jgi:hypothetical protein
MPKQSQREIYLQQLYEEDKQEQKAREQLIIHKKESREQSKRNAQMVYPRVFKTRIIIQIAQFVFSDSIPIMSQVNKFWNSMFRYFHRQLEIRPNAIKRIKKPIQKKINELNKFRQEYVEFIERRNQHRDVLGMKRLNTNPNDQKLQKIRESWADFCNEEQWSRYYVAKRLRVILN